MTEDPQSMLARSDVRFLQDSRHKSRTHRLPPTAEQAATTSDHHADAPSWSNTGKFRKFGDTDVLSAFEPTVVGAVRRYFWLVAIVVAGSLLAGGALVAAHKSNYSATASMIVQDPLDTALAGGQTNTTPDRYVADQLAVLRSVTTATRASELGRQARPPVLQPPPWFLTHFSVRASAKDSNLVTVNFTGPTPETAIQGASTVVAAYRDVVRSGVAAEASALLAQMPVSGAQDPQLAARRAELLAEAEHPTDGVVQSFLPTAASSSRRSYDLRVLVLTLAVGIAMGTGLAYVLARRRPVFTNSNEPELVLDAPLLVEVRDSARLGRRSAGPNVETISSPHSEAMRIASRFILDRRSGAGRGMSLAIVSAGNAADRTMVAASIALALATDGVRTLVIDGDSSRALSQLLAGMLDGPTTEFAEAGTDLSSTIRWVPLSGQHPTPLSGQHPSPLSGQHPSPLSGQHPTPLSEQRPTALRVTSRIKPIERPLPELVPTTTIAVANESLAVPTHQLPGLLRELEDTFDVILIDTTPFLQSAHAAALSSAAGNALVVVDHGGSVPDNLEVARRLEMMGTVPVGYVYNRGVARSNRRGRS
jgi:Mrp family chromosome partitioning ATPase